MIDRLFLIVGAGASRGCAPPDVALVHIEARGQGSGAEVDVRFYAQFNVRDGKVAYIYDHEDRAAAACGCETRPGVRSPIRQRPESFATSRLASPLVRSLPCHSSLVDVFADRSLPRPDLDE